MDENTTAAAVLIKGVQAASAKIFGTLGISLMPIATGYLMHEGLAAANIDDKTTIPLFPAIGAVVVILATAWKIKDWVDQVEATRKQQNERIRQLEERLGVYESKETDQ